MAKSSISIGIIFLRFALAAFLIVLGIVTLQLDSGIIGKIQAGLTGNEIANAIHSFFSGNLANILIILLGICSLVAGIFLVIGFFADLGTISNLALTIILIFWIVFIILVDILGQGGLLKGAFSNFNSFISFLKALAGHCLVLGAILILREG